MARPKAVQRQIDAANAEHAQLLQSLNAPPGAPPPSEPAADPATDPSAPPAQPAGEGVPPVAPPPPAPPAPPPPPAPPEEDFKQKYLTLQGKYNTEIPQLRAEAARLAAKIREQEGLIAQLTAAPPAAPAAAPAAEDIPAELRAEYGDEFFDVVGKQARSVLAPILNDIKSKVDQISARDREIAERTAVNARAAVFTALVEQVGPHWEQINTDQKFLAWLQQPDVLSGQSRQLLLTNAFEANDAARVVMFFKTFLQEDASATPTPTPRQPAVDIGTLVAPGAPRAAPAPAAPGGKRTWSEQEIAVHYAKVRRGLISAAEAARIEKEIIEAAREGRVTK